MPEEGAADATEREESIAEGMMSYKKLLNLQQGVSTLQKTSRTHHEMVMRLERAMSDTISENDLRRAIGLALEEFDSQLVEAFRESNRKCMSMFAKTEEVVEIQSKIDKKVNFTEYNAVLQKLSDLRRYIDTMAESVFIGHQESKEEFAKEVNVEKALKLKADLTELTEVRAKLERLEAVVTANDQKHNMTMDELREQVTQGNAKNIKTNRAMIEANKEIITKLEQEGIVINKRVTAAEENIVHLREDTVKLTEKQDEMQERQDGVIWRACQSLQGLFQSLEGKQHDMQGELKLLHSNVEQFQDFATQRFQQLFDDEEQVKEQVKFLMEASEMLKRRAREFNKNHTSQLKDLTSSDSKLNEQMASLERSFKAHERELRAVEKRMTYTSLAPNSEPLPPTDPVPIDPNQHLQGVMAHLERIANSQPLKLPYSKGVPPLPGGFTEQDAALIPALAGIASLAPQSARSPQGAYGLSPRLPAPGQLPAPPAGPGPGAGMVRTQAPRKVART